MSLQIELTPGEDFYVRDDRFDLVDIHDARSCTIVRVHDGKRFPLTYQTRSEIAPRA